MDLMRKLLIAGVATIAMFGALSGAADARVLHGGYGWGAGAAPPYYFGRPNYGGGYGYFYYGGYYGYPYYGYYGGGFEGCFQRLRTVGYTRGHPIRKRVRVCY